MANQSLYDYIREETRRLESGAQSSQQNQQTPQDARAAMNGRVSERNAQRRAEQLAGVQAKTAGYANGTNPTTAGSVNESGGEEKPKSAGIDLSPKQNVTGNTLYDQWREAMTGRLGKDFEARMNAAEAAADPKKLQDAYRTASDEYDKAKKAESAAWERMKNAPTDAVAEKHRPDYESAKAAREAAEAEFDRSKAQLESAGVELPDTSTWGKIKHLFTGEGQRTTDGFTAEQAAQYKELLSRLDGIQAASAFALTTEQSDALEKERAETLSALHQMDADAGRAERAYDARDRADAFFKSWGKGTAASYTNAAGNVNEISLTDTQTQRELAGLKSQLDRAQAEYDAAVQQYGEAGAQMEKNLLDAAQQRYDGKQAQYAGMEKERAQGDKARQISQRLYGTADKLLTESEQQMAKAKQGTSAAAQFALDAAKTGMDIAADTAASAIGVPGLANMAVRVYGSEAQQARLSGDDAQTAAAKGVKAAMIEVLTEKISGPFEKAYGSTLGKAAAATKVGKAVNAAVDKLKSSGLIRLAMGAAGEGFEEGMSDVLNTVADHVAGWDDGTGTIWDDIKGDKEQILYDMLLGAFVGTFGGAGNLARGNANAAAEAAPTQQTAPAASAESRAPTQPTQYPQGTDTQEARPGILERARAAREQKKAAEEQATAEFFEAQAQYYEEHGWEAALPKELETKNASKWVKARTAAILEENAARASREAKATPEAEEQAAKGETGAGYLAEAAGPSKGAEAPQTRTEAQGDNPAPAEAENVKQAGSDVLNSALNLNNAETRAEAPAQAQKNAASTQETESTAVNDDPAKHTPEEQTRIEEYKAATDENLVNYIETVRNNPGAKIGRYSLKPVSDKAAADIKALTGVDVSGNKTVIEPRIIEHILKRHGEGGAANSSMRDVNDIARIQYVIDNYDNVEDGGRSSAYQTIKPNGKPGQAQTVKFSKAINGTYYVIEAVPDAKAKTVFVTSAYLSNKKAGDLQTANAEATRVTSETKNAQSPVYETSSRPGSPQASGVAGDVSTTSIPTTAQNVKSKNQENAGGYSNLGSKSPRAKTSQTAGTIMEADITSDERAAQLNKYVQNGRFDYIPDTNKRQTHRAVQAIKEKGWQRAAQEFHDSVAAGESGKDLVARGAVLLNNAGNSDASSQTYLELASDVIELGHKAGETLQAFKILQQLTPEGRLYCMTKTVDKLNRQLSDGQRKAIAKQRLGREYDAKAIKDVVDDYGVKLDQKLVDAYLAAKTDAERDAVISEIQNDIAAQIPSTFEDKLVALRYTAMLGNFKTQGRNVLGNTSSLVTKIVKDRLAATIEGVGYVVSGGKMERTRSVWAGGKLYKEAWADFQAHKAEALGEEKYTNVAQKTSKGIEDARTIFKVNGTWGTENAASEFGRSKAAKFARKGADVGMAALEGWRKATNWTMEAGDAIFARTAYADAMAGWLRAHKVNSFAEATEAQLEKARAFAAKEAQEATFRDSNAFSDAISSFDSGWSSSDNAMLRGMGKVSQGIAPFRKTPANVAVRAFEYSPLGVAESIVKGVQAAKGKATAADVINSISKNATGAAIMWAGYVLSGLGKLRGKEDDKELDAAQKANGAMDYSYITDEGKYISLSQFAPVSIPLFMGARLAELTRDVGIEPKDIVTIVKGTTGVMLDQSMLSGLNDALSGLSNYGSDQDALSQFIENALLSFVSQHVPTIVRQTEQASEKYRQTTYTDKNDPWLSADMQRWIGKTSAGVPGVDFQQEDYIDMWGRKTEQGSLGKRILDAYFNPVYTSQDKSTPLDKKLERLHTENRDKEGFPDVYPDSGSIYTDLDGKGTQMTREEFEQYRIERGTKSRELAQEFFDSDEYGMLSDEQRAEVLRDLYSLAADRALKNVQAAHKISYTGDKDTLAALPDIPQYLAANKLLSDAKNNPTSTNWDSIDKVIDEFSKLSQGAQDVLTDKGLNVKKLLYADSKGIDSKDWYTVHEAAKEHEKETGRGSAWVTAEAIGKTVKGDDAEKLKALEAEFPPNDDSDKNEKLHGKRSAVVRRYNAAINAGMSWDDWTAVEKTISDADASWGATSGKYSGERSITSALRAAGYSKSQAAHIWSIYEKTDKETSNFAVYDYFFTDKGEEEAEEKTASGVPRNRDAAADWVMKHSRAAKRRIS